MSGLLFLTTEDFHISKGNNGNIMCTNIPGFSLILFYSTQCEHCQNLIPIFKQLPGNLGGCQFGMINISHNKQCILMSRDTIAAIKVVPYIILYINGKPYMRYQGPQNIKEISRFIMEVASKVQENNKTISKNDQSQNQQQQQNQSHISNKKNTIPAYTIGRPLIGEDDNICYLDFNEAYTSSNKSNYNFNNKTPLHQNAGM